MASYAYFADVTGPSGSTSTGLYGDSPDAALASVWPSGVALPAQPVRVDPADAAVIAAHITRVHECVARMLRPHRDGRTVLERVAADLDHIAVILAAATENDDLDEHDFKDGDEDASGREEEVNPDARLAGHL